MRGLAKREELATLEPAILREVPAAYRAAGEEPPTARPAAAHTGPALSTFEGAGRWRPAWCSAAERRAHQPGLGGLLAGQEAVAILVDGGMEIVAAGGRKP